MGIYFSLSKQHYPTHKEPTPFWCLDIFHQRSRRLFCGLFVAAACPSSLCFRTGRHAHKEKYNSVSTEERERKIVVYHRCNKYGRRNTSVSSPLFNYIHNRKMQEKYVGYETCFVCRYNFFPKHYSLRPVYMKSCVVGASVVLVCSDVNSMLALSGFNRTFKMWTDFIKYFQYQILENSVSLFCVSYGKMRRESVASKSKQCCIDVELEVLTAVNVNSISCDKMKCSPLKVNRSCGSKWLIRLQNGRISQACDQREVGSYIKTILNYIHLIFKLIFSYLKLLWSGW